MIQEQETFNKYFHDVKKIWSKLSHPNRIIPFCTPLTKNPNFLVIGKNHSNNFDPYDDDKNNEIADAFSKEIAKENTFMEHSHSFAKGINRVVSEINKKYESFIVSKKWIGTNRCAIQTDSKGLGDITKHPEYERYGWKTNMCYATKTHIEAIKNFGITEYHRKSFGICKDYPIKKI